VQVAADFFADDMRTPELSQQACCQSDCIKVWRNVASFDWSTDETRKRSHNRKIRRQYDRTKSIHLWRLRGILMGPQFASRREEKRV
jgi:hypothetical protein